jgi:hypothetical protein
MASAMARASPRRSTQQPAAPRVGNQADLAEGLDEAGPRRGNGDVTGHGQRGTGAGRHAIDGRDRGHAQRLQPAHGGVERLIDHRAGIGALDQIRPGRKVELRQVGPGAEATAGAGDDEGPHRRIGLDVAHGL